MGLALGGALYRFPALRVWQRVSRSPALRWLPRFLVMCAVLQILWIGLLILQLHGLVNHRNLDTSWVGLDVAEVFGMLLVARLLSLRRPAVSPVAAAAATLFALDAWFDCYSARPRLDYALSLTLAMFIELPMALLLASVSWRMLVQNQPAGADSQSVK